MTRPSAGAGKRLAPGLLALAAMPSAAFAETYVSDGLPAVIDVLGGHGCTFSVDSRAALSKEGYTDDFIGALIAAALKKGLADQSGDHVTLDQTICTIRLPHFESALTVTSPKIVAMTSAKSAFADQGYLGCCLQDVSAGFDRLFPDDPEAPFKAITAFYGAGMMSGDLRIYVASPLNVPPGMQTVAGDCGDVPNRDAIDRSHEVLLKGFGEAMRVRQQTETCTKEGLGLAAMEHALKLQGASHPEPEPGDPEVNSLLHWEFDMIAIAAGWHDGMSSKSRGKCRPALCHGPLAG